MTLIVAAVQSNVALLAADTRTSVMDWDAAAKNFAPRAFVDGQDDKFLPVSNGFIVGSPLAIYKDFWPALHREALPATIAGASRAILDSAPSRATVAFLAEAFRRQRFFHIGAWSNGLHGQVYDSSGTPVETLDNRCEIVVPWAPDWTRYGPLEAIRRLYVSLIASADVAAVLRATGWLFGAVRDRCGPQGSISDHVEVRYIEWAADGQAAFRRIAPAPWYALAGVASTADPFSREMLVGEIHQGAPQ
jgi:hypothetical protein